jgi:hypothetical protein
MKSSGRAPEGAAVREALRHRGLRAWGMAWRTLFLAGVLAGLPLAAPGPSPQEATIAQPRPTGTSSRRPDAEPGCSRCHRIEPRHHHPAPVRRADAVMT